MTVLAELAMEQQGSADVDLLAAIRSVLERSAGPLTLPRIRADLPWRWQSTAAETLAEVLQRQVAAHVLYGYPRYRSQHERYWVHPPCRHLEDLLGLALAEGEGEAEGLFTWNDIRRRLPEYAKIQAAAILEEMVACGRVFRHPPVGPRGGPRFGLSAPDARVYVRPELDLLFGKLEKQGFTLEQLRSAALALLHEAEFAG